MTEKTQKLIIEYAERFKDSVFENSEDTQRELNRVWNELDKHINKLEEKVTEIEWKGWPP